MRPCPAQCTDGPLARDARTPATSVPGMSEINVAMLGGGSWGTTVAHLADLGILVAPGDFYGKAGEKFVRVALTATDERVQTAAERLS